jgi:drug/metabolite transporter (DMT)-like permease
MKNITRGHAQGLNAAFASALFLGLAPVFGKLSIVAGLHWATVVSLRTLLATFLLILMLLFFKREYFYIYPAGLAGCMLAGFINGIGSLLYYGALWRIDASLGQIIYSLYPLFVALWLWMDHQTPSKLTIIRMVLILPALLLLTQIGQDGVDLLGVAMMLGSAALYALHLPINQRVLFEMPSPTVTLYTLLAMSFTVLPAFLLNSYSSATSPALPSTAAWFGLLGLTLVTFLSRLTLFLGVKQIGGTQTALIGLGELLVTLLFAHLLLGDRLETTQWFGVALLIIILLMARLEKPAARKNASGGWFSWFQPPVLPAEFPPPSRK